MNLKKKFSIKPVICLILFIIVTTSYSCKKFLEVPPPSYQLTSDQVFENDETANSAIAGIYSNIMENENHIFSSAITISAGLYADELKVINNADYSGEFESSKITQANHGYLSTSYWAPAYKYIYSVNSCLEKLENSAVTPTTKMNLMGEAKFIRAFCYFYLINLFGDVPLVLGTDYSINSQLPRSPKASIYEQIIKDLRDAKKLLSVHNGSTRPSRFAATSLLARVMLYTGKWEEANRESSEVIESGYFKLLANLNEVFLKESVEAIWQLKPVEEIWNTWEGKNFLFAGESDPSQFYVSDTLYSSFTSTDNRKQSWITTRNYLGSNIRLPYKYKVYGNNAPITEYYTVFRLAEQYLIRSEARAMVGDLVGAANDLNQVRVRAGLGIKNITSLENLIASVNEERRHELFCEWGHRWFDLSRWGMANALLTTIKPDTWQPHQQLWPIPINQINTNPNLIQNPGY